MIVVDAMIVAYAVVDVPDHTPAVNELLEIGHAWAAPPLWRSELRNVLLQYIRVSEETRPGEAVSLKDARRKMGLAETLVGQRTYAVDSDAVFDAVAGTNLSAYDGEYVALAQEMGVPLVTVDSAVLEAVSNIAVRPEDVAASDR